MYKYDIEFQTFKTHTHTQYQKQRNFRIHDFVVLLSQINTRDNNYEGLNVATALSFLYAYLAFIIMRYLQ